MRRRKFLALIGGAAAAWPLAARAQQASRIFRIGFVGLPTADSLPKRPEAFRAGLRDLGYHEGGNIVIEFRWADGHYERLPALFSELIRLNVDVIVTHGTPGGLAAKQATTTIPIVFATAGDAVASGLVASLARPGGNVTGSTYFVPVAPFHRSAPPVLSTERIAHSLVCQDTALRDLNPVHVGWGSDSVIRRCRLNVRFARKRNMAGRFMSTRPNQYGFCPHTVTRWP